MPLEIKEDGTRVISDAEAAQKLYETLHPRPADGKSDKYWNWKKNSYAEHYRDNNHFHRMYGSHGMQGTLPVILFFTTSMEAKLDDPVTSKEKATVQVVVAESASGVILPPDEPNKSASGNEGGGMPSWLQAGIRLRPVYAQSINLVRYELSCIFVGLLRYLHQVPLIYNYHYSELKRSAKRSTPSNPDPDTPPTEYALRKLMLRGFLLDGTTELRFEAEEGEVEEPDDEPVADSDAIPEPPLNSTNVESPCEAPGEVPHEDDFDDSDPFA